MLRDTVQCAFDFVDPLQGRRQPRLHLVAENDIDSAAGSKGLRRRRQQYSGHYEYANRGFFDWKKMSVGISDARGMGFSWLQAKDCVRELGSWTSVSAPRGGPNEGSSMRAWCQGRRECMREGEEGGCNGGDDKIGKTESWEGPVPYIWDEE